MPTKDIILSATDLSMNFSNVKALDSVSMTFQEGSIFGFLGPNGAGKTTTIKILLGLLKPTSGTATVMNFDVTKDSDKIREFSGVLLEHTGLYEMLSAEDNLDYYGRIWGLSDRQRRERIKELLVNINLWDRRKEKVGKWSKGMKQKLAVARCLVHRPKLVFLDEPTSGLDPEATSIFRTDLLGMVKNEGTSVFLTTHNLDEAEKICDIVGIINRGKILAIGTPQDLKDRSSKNDHYEISVNRATDELVSELRLLPDVANIAHTSDTLSIELIPQGDISAIISMLTRSGIEIYEAKKSRPGLEQVYLDIVQKV